jgi:Fic family protein
VTAVLDGKRVLGLPREIQEVRNAFAAYEHLPDWQPAALKDLLAAHGVLMAGLLDDAGHFRSGGVGIYRGDALMHMAPPASRVLVLIQDLLEWLARGELHPLVASCVFHYEFEFIHPFADGNGRLGRLWQTLILCRWKPLLAFLPVETVVRDRQDAYYQALAEADRSADTAPFVAFMLQALHTAMTDTALTDPVDDPVSDPVKQLLAVFQGAEALKTGELLNRLGLKHRPSFRKSYLQPALAGGWIEMTQPESPSSPVQKYRLTAKARRLSTDQIK